VTAAPVIQPHCYCGETLSALPDGELFCPGCRARRRAEGEPVPEAELTLADDCATLLEAWFQTRAQHGRVLLMDFELKRLASRMRAIGAGAKR
jgi:hypothetical protein